MREVRETLTHLTSLNRYEDVRVMEEPAAGGIRLRYVLVPLHPVDRVEFRGSLGLSENELRSFVNERYGGAPSAGRAQEVADGLLTMYGERGYPKAQVTPGIEETHAPDRATLAFQIQSGPRAAIGRLEVDEIDAVDRPVVSGDIGVRVGDPYDNAAILQSLERYAASLRARGFYEARALHSASFDADGTATVRITVDRGPMVTVEFAGDPLPEADRDRLVPVRAEGSADEDLLEDATLAIEEYLHMRGYRDAVAEHSRAESGGMLTITFTIARGPRYLVDDVAISGNSAVPTAELAKLVQIEAGQPFVQTNATRAAASIRDFYRARGFTRVAVQGALSEGDRREEGGAADRRLTLHFNVTEGARTLVSSIAFSGNTVLAAEQLRQLMTTGPGRPYSESDVVAGRDRIDIEYRNRGYESVVVEPAVAVTEHGADIRFAVAEGPQVIVDHVIIVGNERTSTETISARAVAAARRAVRLFGAHREPAAPGRARPVPSRGDRRAAACGRTAARRARPGRGGAADDGRVRRRRGGWHPAAADGRRRAGGGAVRVRAARLLRDRQAQSVGQEPGGQSLQPRQPALARRGAVAERHPVRRARGRKRVRVQRVPRAGDASASRESSTRRPTCW